MFTLKFGFFLLIASLALWAVVARPMYEKLSSIDRRRIIVRTRPVDFMLLGLCDGIEAITGLPDLFRED